MKFKSFIWIFLFILPVMFGCKGLQQQVKHAKSSVVGLERKAVHISPTGIIREWEGKLNIEIDGAFIRFITDDGKTVYISGSIIVEEK